MRTFVSTQGRYINLLTQCSRTYSRGIQRYDLDTADSLSHSERFISILVDSGRWPPVFITSRSRGPQLDVRNKSSVNDFLFGPEPVCRLTLNRVSFHVLHHTSSSGNRGWLHLLRAARRSPPALCFHRHLLRRALSRSSPPETEPSENIRDVTV